MNNLFTEFCHIFCCPPRPSHIVAKFAFLPPIPTYTIVQEANEDKRRIIFKPEAGFLSDEAKSDLEVFYTITKRNSRVACMYIPFDKRANLRSSSRRISTQQNHQSTHFTVLFSHGNAVDIGQMAEFLHSLSQCFQVNIFTYDYSGYGASSGQALEENLYADAHSALSELRNRFSCPLDRIILYGQSIGTAPTVEVATKHKVAGVVLHSPLMSGIRLVCPGTTRSFCFDPFTNIDKVEKITSPTLIIHGTEDEVVGIHHGQALFSRLHHPLEPLWVEGAGHNDIEHFPEYSQRLHKLFSEELLMSAPSNSFAMPTNDNGLGDVKNSCINKTKADRSSKEDTTGSLQSGGASVIESINLTDERISEGAENISSINLLQRHSNSNQRVADSLDSDQNSIISQQGLSRKNNSTLSLPADTPARNSTSQSQKTTSFVSLHDSYLQ